MRSFSRIQLTLGIVGSCVLASNALASRKYGAAGCGLGSLVFQPNGMQVLAATTNSTFYSQLFGITSGTSNCTPDAAGVAALDQENFVTANYGTLSKEMAQGQGSTVAGLATVLGCDEAVYPQFASFAQAKYATVFAAPGMLAMLDQLKIEMAQNSQLTTQCKFAGLN
jgi:Protein of unknown function (DUF3015)